MQQRQCVENEKMTVKLVFTVSQTITMYCGRNTLIQWLKLKCVDANLC